VLHRKPNNYEEKKEWYAYRSIINKIFNNHIEDLKKSCTDNVIKYSKGQIKDYRIPVCDEFNYDMRGIAGSPAVGVYKDDPLLNKIHKTEYKRYLKISNAWPLDDLLANWWPTNENQKLIQHPTTTPTTKKTRTDNLKKAIESAMKEINKPCSFNSLWVYFEKELDETGHIIGVKDDVISWQNSKGTITDSKKKSVANRFYSINKK